MKFLSTVIFGLILTFKQ